MARNCIGLDIGSNSIKAVHLKRSKGGYRLNAFGIQPLVPQTIVDSAIMDHSAVVEAIRSLWSRLRLKQKEVAVAIAGHSVIVKKIQVPQMSTDELFEHIPYEAEHHIPFAKDDVEIDFQVLNRKNASGHMDLLLVAAKKDVVHDYIQVVRDAGLHPTVIDVAAFSAQNGFEANYHPHPDEAVVLINVGAAISNINVLRDGISLFTRDVTIGGNALTEEIQKQLAVPHEQAEAIKTGDLANERPDLVADVQRICDGVSDVIAGEFQRSLDFFLATSADTQASRICISGGGAKFPGLYRAIERRSRMQVEIVNSWKDITFDPSLDEEFLAGHSPEALIGVGLAMRTSGDTKGMK